MSNDVDWQEVALDGPPPHSIAIDDVSGQLVLSIKTDSALLAYKLCQVWHNNRWEVAIVREHRQDGVMGPQEYVLLPLYEYDDNLYLPDLVMRFLVAMQNIVGNLFVTTHTIGDK